MAAVVHEHQALEERNKLLDELHNSVLSTRQFAVKIGDELGSHETMLSQLHGGVNEATEESARQQRGVVQLLKDTKDSGFYGTVFVLVLIIIVLLAV